MNRRGFIKGFAAFVAAAAMPWKLFAQVKLRRYTFDPHGPVGLHGFVDDGTVVSTYLNISRSRPHEHAVAYADGSYGIHSGAVDDCEKVWCRYYSQRRHKNLIGGDRFSTPINDASLRFVKGEQLDHFGTLLERNVEWFR